MGIRRGGVSDWSPVVIITTPCKKPMDLIIQTIMTSMMQRMMSNGNKGNAIAEDLEVGTSRWRTFAIMEVDAYKIDAAYLLLSNQNWESAS